MAIHVFDIEKDVVMTPIISKDARLVIGPHSGASTATFNHVVLEPGEQNQPHSHPKSEDTIFILEGEGIAVDYTNGKEFPIQAGCAVHIPVGIKHTIISTGKEKMVSVGGPCPPDYNLLKACGIDITPPK
ncbi:cupin domain-containing protein [Bacillus sp. B15-48]|uniref:cupin domain-containing protein n=1 Tax=Bacillus sp. B15-48 TaxID=1548601 RepID=UPI00193FF236|nr:cupin domain-containing protein [Bacillus sp. B15-48]MBM4765035.1 cupin domain-containing protein [Bacillus sp. B15-48]